MPSFAWRTYINATMSISFDPCDSQRLNCWPRGTLVTRLYERGSLALSLIRSSGETRAHRSPSARPAFLTVCRLLYSNDSFHSFSSAEFCSAYQSLPNLEEARSEQVKEAPFREPRATRRRRKSEKSTPTRGTGALYQNSALPTSDAGKIASFRQLIDSQGSSTRRNPRPDGSIQHVYRKALRVLPTSNSRFSSGIQV